MTGKQENDSDFPYDNLTYADKTQPKYQMINGGEKAEEPGAPKRAGYTFGGWYYIDENGKETEWDFNKPVNGNMRLTAKWDPVPKEPSSEEKKPAEKKKIKTERKKKIRSFLKMQSSVLISFMASFSYTPISLRI